MTAYSAQGKCGLYDPQFEHDACGIGIVANIKGRKSNAILAHGLEVLRKLSHRGGVGSEPDSGDGAGILLQIPHDFLRKAVMDRIDLPAPGQYGVGMIFLPTEAGARSDCERLLAKACLCEEQTLLGWRDVPVRPDGLGRSAKACMPYIRQVFIGRGPGVDSEEAFERKLFVIRKLTENAVREAGITGFYAASLSCRTIVYKGMLTPEQLGEFYLDLGDPDVVTALALVHSRYSTNTFPSWERAHPNRYIIHNGEINTLRGNINRMNARESMLATDVFGDDLNRVLPILNPDGSDSAMFDNVVEFLMLSGRPLPKVMTMMIPEPWEAHESMSDEKKAFYEYQSCVMEPWDGPAAIGFTDGVRVGAVLDRNGLRPARYYVTDDDMVVLASEVGVLDVPPERIVRKDRLRPGRMLLIDTEKGRIIGDDELKESMAKEHPYREWLDREMTDVSSLPEAPASSDGPEPLDKLQKAFGYSYEDLRLILAPLAQNGVDPVGAMGNDIPLAVLSEKPQMLYDYFKQLFAQVTNPPIDALREAIVTSSTVLLGSEGNLLGVGPESCHMIKLRSPVISDETLAKLKNIDKAGFRSVTLPILFDSDAGGAGLEKALAELFDAAAQAVRGGANIIILSDRGVDKTHTPIPALLAVSGVHQHLTREGLKTRASIVLESGEPREVHHFACLVSFGASAIDPYLAYRTVDALTDEGTIPGGDRNKSRAKYVKAVTKGVVKTLSKMGISTIQSYQGAQIFEALGLSQDFVDKYFTSTVSRIGGIGASEVAKEAALRHDAAYTARAAGTELDTGGLYKYRRSGEYHLFNPATIHALQVACRTGDYAKYKQFSEMFLNGEEKLCTLRGLMDFKSCTPVPLDEVESVESILRRFKAGAMSFGALSKEAHETIAIAMNRIGARSNTGEGGEDPARYTPDPNGDSRCSAIKQVASGRFGVTGEYLANCVEIQIKMAQGAKPGEGGQLPGRKVYPWVAKVRYSTPGVGLISPPPHHDIYSIEDLKQLIHDLKCANPGAKINVKLVSEAGVGTIAAGVAKALADVILISGYDGGTGASPRSSTRHTGLPWELGLAETQQTLLLNDLRSRVTLETDGKLMTGRDVAIAALLGAEEYGFGTALLVALGCVMMRVCNLDTCPVGICTQNPELRAKFTGDPQHVVNYLRFVASELREIMASLGLRTVDEMIGRVDLLEPSKAERHWKAQGVDLSSILYTPQVPDTVGRRCLMSQDHGLDASLDRRELLKICAPAVERGEKVDARVAIHNTDRTAATILGYEITKKYGSAGLPDDTVRLRFEGTAGQSFGAFIPHGVTLDLTGDANDYIGKGLSGGRIIVSSPKGSTFVPEDNVIIGNVAFYGATAGEAYISGAAGERFCVRNSGINAVVESVGDHGCEYMTGGRVAILGKTGRNFAAGMSGGIAYVLDEDGTFPTRCNKDMVDLEPVASDAELLRSMIENHVKYTGSALGARILARWDEMLPKFVKIVPRDYWRMMCEIDKAHKAGLKGEEALMAAFEANNRDLARVAGN